MTIGEEHLGQIGAGPFPALPASVAIAVTVVLERKREHIALPPCDTELELADSLMFGLLSTFVNR
ncbi:MAG: hypothetical protein OXH61_03855 [Acidimicrobiaceae bacterium]|nr:hypothetical protein [Acidimicrobiaceae bacterium]